MKSNLFFVACFSSILLFTACTGKQKIHLLVFSKTEAFRHESIDAGKAALSKLAREKDFEVTFTEDTEYFNEKELKKYNV